MHKYIILTVVSLFMLCANEKTALAQVNSKTGIHKIELSLTESITRLDEALVSNKKDELQNLLSDNVQLIHSNGLTENKNDVIKNLRDGSLVYTSIVQNGDCRKTIIQSEKKAIVTRDIDVKGIVFNEPFDVQLTTHEEWILEGGEWKLLNRKSENR